MSYTLVIGDKALSSWSLRPWLAMKMTGIPFTEKLVRLGRPESRAELRRASPSSRVPALVHGPLTVWESASIGEYLAERHPEARLWPVDPFRRAEARSVCHEMHAGFSTLRTRCPFAIAERRPTPPLVGELQREVARLTEIWTHYRRIFADTGPFLFGHFTYVDAMFAPVASRFVTYGLRPDTAEAAAYGDMLMQLPAMNEWKEAAERE